jgi:hypothetical protein
MVVVAVYLSIVGVLQVPPAYFPNLGGSFVLVGLLRIAFGPRKTHLLSVVGVAGYLWYFVCIPPFSLDFEVIWWALYLGAAGGIVFGSVLFLIVEGGFRFVDWADNLLRTKAETETRQPSPVRQGRFHWIFLGMLCGIVLAVMNQIVEPVPFGGRRERMVSLQRDASALFWYSLIGTCIGIVIDLLRNSPKTLRFSLRGVLLFVLVCAMFLSACLLYIRIVTLPP